MKSYIYQAKRPSFDSHREGQRVSLLDLHNDFDCVAVVTFTQGDANEGIDYMLEVAYEKTNHINCAWWENAGIEVRKQGRSTSVGDVVVLEHSDGKESIHGVAEMGWRTLRF